MVELSYQDERNKVGLEAGSGNSCRQCVCVPLGRMPPASVGEFLVFKHMNYFSWPRLASWLG